ncbi:MAG: filamentous hemagglutinin N-terminal domain-containing protein [Pseudomonadota bacterium]
MLKRTLLSISIASALGTAQAEVVTDGSVGAAMSLSGPDFQVGAELGQQVGSNLFHSFTTFNVNTGESATFSGPDTISNVISRVTGGSASSIDGVLRNTIPGADLYLLNPAGIMFGPNASLDVQGSLHVSTADVMRFDDGGEFNATLTASSSFSMASPSAFGFLSDTPAGAGIDGDPNASFASAFRFRLPAGETFSIVAGDINMTNSSVPVSGGRVNVAAVSGAGDVTLDAQGLTSSAPAGNVTLTNSTFEVGGLSGAGNVYISAADFTLDGGDLRSQSLGGSSGVIDVQATNINLVNGASVNTRVRGDGGQGGSINLQAQESINISGTDASGFSVLVASDTFFGDSPGGEITLSAADIQVNDGARVSVDTAGDGQGGNININASNTLTITGENSFGEVSNVAARAASGFSGIGTGNAGSINIQAGQVQIQNGAQITTSTLSNGQGGNVSIMADSLALSGESSNQVPSVILSNAVGEGGSLGQGGEIDIQTSQVQLQDGAQIASATFGNGDAGAVSINASGTVDISGSSSSGFTSGVFASASAIPGAAEASTLTGQAPGFSIVSRWNDQSFFRTKLRPNRRRRPNRRWWEAQK